MNVKRGIYTISFDKSIWNGERASQWLENYDVGISPVYSVIGFKYMKVLVTRPPKGATNLRYYRVDLPNGIKIMNWEYI